MKHKIERLAYEDLKIEPPQRRTRAKDKGIIPLEKIQHYLDGKDKLGWKLVQVVPLYEPVTQYGGGANKIYGYDYYWLTDEQ